MRIVRRAGVSSIAAMALTIAAWGCSGEGGYPHVKTVPASGKVSYKGKPIEKGTIVFEPTKPGEETNAIAGNIENGEFTLTTNTDKPGDGAPPGEYKVGVSVTEEVPTKQEYDTTLKYIVPEKYASPSTSGLTAVVPPEGTKTLDIKIP